MGYPKIISLSSVGSGVGKDTVAERLVNQWGYKQFSWASELRRRVAAVDFPDAPNHYREFAYHIVPDKDWEKSVGFDKALVQYPDRESVFEQNKIYIDSCIDDLVISDTRFVNEVDYLVKSFDDVRLVKVNGEARRGVRECDNLLSHIAWDYQLLNYGSLEELYTAVDVMMHHI
jgi:hypothetical protein